MKKRSLWLITALMTVALLGVFVMQLYYIREAYNLKSQLFEQSVNEALNAVVQKAQKKYAAMHLTRKDYEIKEAREKDFRDRAQEIVDYKELYKKEQERRMQEREKRIYADLNVRDSMLRAAFLDARIIGEDVFQAISNTENKGKSPLQVQVDVAWDEYGNVRGNINQTINMPRKPTFSSSSLRLPDSIRYLATNPRNLNPIVITLERVRPEDALRYSMEDRAAEKKYKEGLKLLMEDTVVLEGNNLNLIADVAKEMQQEYIPVNQRVPHDVLDTLLKKELANRNVDLQYDFWLKMATKDTVLYHKAAHSDQEALPKDTYRTTLFSNDLFGDPGMLYVYFPKRNSLILSNMGVTMASSAGLLLVLVFIFSYTLYSIVRQKKISEMKTDFINNMTHEFKTPVATIMIASEALKDPEIAEDKKRINRLAGIIYDENVRLGNHIERVLSIARLEKKEIKLEHHEININELIVAVTDSMSLQLQKRNAEVKLALDAEQPVVYGDELHFSNVIYNLIDNANKYSADAPQISIRTRNTSRSLVIEVADKGIGMTREQSKRIFDQFYRVPTGNLHDVKGFGLGLNYVQDIITQMNGAVKVHSEKDKGSLFEISLPITKTKDA
ncbi:sensor histidine kinase [Pedobacter faecalis]|uniref:sensor histidine kinase n=1 Tax=Pedobacter faecalis TaxID=3041495 RepID=UPI00254AFC53|nr:HAMP domain-containing sensor histidine kinase [Pedobacter sp. ELA7]